MIYKSKMASNVNNLSDTAATFSKYYNSLEASAKLRYGEKVEICGLDPYKLKPSDFIEDLTSLPSIEYPDIVNYLVLQTSWATNKQMKAYKSLDAFNFFVSGWVSSLLTKTVQGDKVLVYARVNHSQRARDTALKPWILSEKSGDVILAHCDCMAGLSEACSHIGALLFATEAGSRMSKSITCTQEKSKWLPTHVKKVPYLPVIDVDFSSAKKKHKNLSCGKEEETSMPTRGRKSIQLVTPSLEEISNFYKGIAASGAKSAVLTVVSPFNEEFVLKQTQGVPKPLTTLHSEEYMNLNYVELLDACDKISLAITKEECEAIERETQKQAQSKVWFSQRAGRITASRLKAACHTDPAKPSRSLIKTICYPEAHKFTSTATRWGCAHESMARETYEREMCGSHEHFVVTDSGLNINPQWPYLGASPDGLVNCDCCGKGSCEIKCPFCYKDATLQEASGQKNSCLTEIDGKLMLDRKHAYYYQVQAQIFIIDVEYCDFVVWTEKDVHIERIHPDNVFWEEALAKSSKFYRVGILPEIIGKWYSRPVKVNTEESDGESGPWCYCRADIEGSQLIGYDNDDCKIIWFHMQCLRLDSVPKGQWYCPSCRAIQ